MRCLVTGAAGFVGSHLVERLHRLGHDVEGMDFQEAFSRPLAPLAHLSRKWDCAAWTNFESLSPRYDWVFHLGACTDTTQWDENYLRIWNTDFSKKVQI
jgi:UDP-glucose 4-epimerase